MSLCALRVETGDGASVCLVIGESPMKTFAVKNGLALVPVETNGRMYLGRECERCGAGQGDYFPTRSLGDRDAAWLDRHRVFRLPLPKQKQSFFSRALRLVNPG